MVVVTAEVLLVVAERLLFLLPFFLTVSVVERELVAMLVGVQEPSEAAQFQMQVYQWSG